MFVICSTFTIGFALVSVLLDVITVFYVLQCMMTSLSMKFSFTFQTPLNFFRNDVIIGIDAWM